MIRNAIIPMAVASVLTLATINTAHSEVNVRIDPLNTLIGRMNVQVDFGIASAWSLGPTLQYTNKMDEGYKINAYGFGVRGNYAFNGNIFTQGWYLGPSISYVNVKVTDDNSILGDLEGKGSGVAFSVLGGYQWMWEHFNINLGAGPVFYTLGDIVVENDAGTYEEKFSGYNEVGLGLEFTLGWKF